MPKPARSVTRSAGLLEVPADAEGAFEIARRSRGTPRIANRLLRRVRDGATARARRCHSACATLPQRVRNGAEVEGDGRITQALAQAALAMLDLDPLRPNLMDPKRLEAVVHRFDAGPVGIHHMAAAIGEEASTIEAVIEPCLIQQGGLQRTPRGRVATLAAYRHLGVVPPKGGTANRFQG